MDDPAIIATWAAVIAAIFGPLIGVGLASSLARQDARRTEATSVFRRIMEDAQNYRHAFSDLFWLESEAREKTDKKEALEYQLSLSRVFVKNLATSYTEEEQNKIDSLSADLQRVKSKHAKALNDTRALDTLLNTDRMSLGLLFDMKSEKCGRAIERLIGISDVLKQKELPPRGECQDQLNERVLAISKEMRPLYESLRKLDPSI